MTKQNVCRGCGTPPAFDHYHQYVNVHNEVVDCYCIDGIVFKLRQEATAYLTDTLDCTLQEVLQYMKTLKKLYG